VKPIRIFRHVACEGPGYLAELLEERQIPYELVCIDQGEAVPTHIQGVSALVFMGGPMSVNDNLSWIGHELDVIRRAVAQDMPILGHCLGGQLIAKALGAEVSANPVKEIGWLPVQKAATPEAEDWLGDITDNNLLFHWHGETFGLPNGAAHILKSKNCLNQGFVTGNTLALQCHVEMTADMVREWSSLYEDELASPSETVQSRQVMTQDLDNKVTMLQGVAKQLYQRWLQPLLA
jgi:GMP synthase-like glutamine amidotransferase